MKKLNILISAVLICGFAAGAAAQKVPAVQKASLWAPANIKIDGRVNEWSGKFEAYNATNGLFYTIANDDKNLYLVVFTSSHAAINKFYVGGITFAVNPVGKKKNEDKLAVTFPVIRAINNGDYLHAQNEYTRLAKDSIANRAALKTLIALKNKEFSSVYKQIKTNGFKNIEPLISMYNAEGILVKSGFDNKFNYVYELAIPLKYLETAFNSLGKFRYNIKLNGTDRDGKSPYPQRPVALDRNGQPIINMAQLYTENPTDFGGECTLAKNNK